LYEASWVKPGTPLFKIDPAPDQAAPRSSNKRCTIISEPYRQVSEVEDSLIAMRQIREQQAAQDWQVQPLQRTLRLANLRYENGYSSFLEVLDAQRSLFSAELQQVQLQRARFGGHRQSLQSAWWWLGA
jgi:multidrug resistance efflux pump